MPSRRSRSTTTRAWMPSRTTKSNPRALSTLLGAAQRSLPSRQATNAGRRAPARARPALAVLATGAGAVIGARQLRRRRQASDALALSAEPAHSGLALGGLPDPPAVASPATIPAAATASADSEHRSGPEPDPSAGVTGQVVPQDAALTLAAEPGDEHPGRDSTAPAA